MQKGRLAIEFAVLKNGRIAGLKLITSSGDVELDRAAWRGITVSDPFPHLPSAFKGDFLALCLRFYYNPESSDFEQLNTAKVGLRVPTAHAMLMARESAAHFPKYPKEARRQKTEGLVRLEIRVGRDGRVDDLKLLDGDPLLENATAKAVRKWRFYPAHENGKAIEERVRIAVTFRLRGEPVWAQVESYPVASLATAK